MRSAETESESAAEADRDRRHEGRRPGSLNAAAVLESLDGLGGTAEELDTAEEAAGTEVQLGKEPTQDAHAAIGAEPRERDVLATNVQEVDVPHDRSEAERLGQPEAEVEGGRVPEDVAVDGGSVVTEHRRHPEAETNAAAAVEREADLVAGQPGVGGVSVAAQEDQRANGHAVLDGHRRRRRGGRLEVQALEEPRTRAVLGRRKLPLGDVTETADREHRSFGELTDLADLGANTAQSLLHLRDACGEGVDRSVDVDQVLGDVRVV